MYNAVDWISTLHTYCTEAEVWCFVCVIVRCHYVIVSYPPGSEDCSSKLPVVTEAFRFSCLKAPKHGTTVLHKLHVIYKFIIIPLTDDVHIHE